MEVDWLVDGDEESVKAYDMIIANTIAGRRLIAPDAPKEKIMSMETVMENRRQIDKICARLRAREAAMTREVADG